KRTIHVSKVPHSKQNTASLVPASELLLVEIWHSNLQQARVGEPLTRQIQISARGQRSESLPDIELDSVSAANIYPETVSRDNQLANGELMAKASYHFAIIPTQAGTMTLPAVELPWWNTKTGKMDIARIPSQDIQVAAVVNPNTTQNERSLNSSQNGNIVTNADNDKAQSAGGSAHDPTNESDMTKELSGALPETLDSAQAPEAGHYLDKEAPWRLISVVFACLWIATTIISFILWRLNRASNNATRTKEAPHNNPTYAEQKAFADLQRACQQNNAQQAKLALNHWISTQKSNAKSVTHRDDSTVLHASESFESAVDSLNHALFSSSAEQRDSAWSGDELLTAVLEIRTQATKPSTNQEDALAPLYPTQKRPTSI
ncbi:protein BatD, partial [bacterium]|nr:protein BatD [bacterium]